MKHKKPTPRPQRQVRKPSPVQAVREVLPAGRRLGEPVRTALFFGAFYVYVWLVVNPRLIYDCATITNFPVFYRGWAFFVEAMSQPGGLLKYVSAFSSHLFYLPWAGAAVITAQAWAMSACTGRLFRTVRLPGARWLRFIPALLVLAAYAQYTYHLPSFMGVLASLFFAGLYTMAAPRRWAPAVYAGLSPVLYLIGAGAYLPFAVLSALYECLYRRRYGVGVLYLLFAAMVPYIVGVMIFHVSLANAYTELLPVSWKIVGSPARERMVTVVYTLYLLPMAGILVGGLGRMVMERRHRREDAVGVRPLHGPVPKGRSEVLSGVRRMAGAPAGSVAGLVLLFAVGVVVALSSTDAHRKAVLEVHHYACRRMWPQVLAAARRCPEENRTMNAVNRALYHGGRFNQDMFAYPQRPEGLLQTGEDHVTQSWHVFDTLIDLGLTNLAEKNLTECLETCGEHPMILERLALVHLVKGKTGAARICLGALRKTLFHARRADAYLAKLDADPNLAGDAEIQRLRAQSLEQDYTAGFFAQETLLSALVRQGSGNRMAYEYLMAWYLLNKRLDKFVQALERLPELGYVEVPPLYEEAALIYAYGTRKPVPLTGYTARPEARRRIEQFSETFERHNRNKEAAFAELAQRYRQSYFFYFIYASGPTRK